MKFLLDANIWLQIVRDRERADEARSLIEEVPASGLFVTDFALHAVALVMGRHKTLSQFPAFLSYSSIGNAIELVRLTPGELVRVVEVSVAYKIDFDDAYQYVAAELHNLKLVSLDADFDRTPNGRLTPLAAVTQFREEQRKQG